MVFIFFYHPELLVGLRAQWIHFLLYQVLALATLEAALGVLEVLDLPESRLLVQSLLRVVKYLVQEVTLRGPHLLLV